ncbi:MAG: HDOD domain-containing protein [bacterium]
MAEQKNRTEVEVLADKIDSIPSLPQVTNRVVALVNKAETDASDLGRAIRSDPSLSAQVLKFANSRYYGRAGKVNSIQQAVTILGFNTVRSLALSYGMEQHYTAPECDGFPREEFWNYSLAVGAAGEIISKRLGFAAERQDCAFSAGHLHAIGRAVIDQHLHRELIRILQKANSEGLTMIQAEEETLETTHCELGAAVLEHWNLPSILSKTARYYYYPAEAEDEMVTVIHLASVLAKTKNLGFSGDDDISYLNEEEVNKLGLADDAIEIILREELPREFDRISS